MVPKLEYISTGRYPDWRSAWGVDIPKPWEWGSFTHIAHCMWCSKYTEDHTRDYEGNPMPEYLYDSADDWEIVCMHCLEKAVHKEREEQIIETLERKLGLAEKHRDALRDFIETIFTDPKKIVQLADLNNRVGSLERQINFMWLVISGLVLALLALVVALVDKI